MYHPMEFPLSGTNGTLVFVNVLSSLGPLRCGASASTVVFGRHHDVGGAHAHDRPKKNPSLTSMFDAGGATGAVGCDDHIGLSRQPKVFG
jgi:hypothetical protein